MGGFDAGEALVEAAEGEGEAVVIETELVEDGGVEIPDVVGVPGDVPGEVIGFAEYGARFDTRAGEWHNLRSQRRSYNMTAFTAAWTR